MMRALVSAIVVLLALHFLGLGGFVGWLYSTGRLNEDRVQRVVDLFEPTVAEAKRQREQEKQKAEQEREKARKAARLEAVSDGPKTLQDRLAAEQRADSLAMHRVERLQQETGDLRQQMERAKELISEQKQKLKQEREQFRQFVEQHNKQQKQEDFKQTVQMYEQLGSEQAKRMFQQLMNEGKTDRVVAYLANMQQRQAGKILQEFETPREIEQATNLLESLRDRGVYPMGENNANANADNNNGAPAAPPEDNRT